jgi:hypothetical protein
MGQMPVSPSLAANYQLFQMSLQGKRQDLQIVAAFKANKKDAAYSLGSWSAMET